jgi:4-amino-4-deoxy-L-arabinose transferase-like glycosyltransferase
MINEDKTRILSYTLIAILGLCGTFVIIFLTVSNGVGVSPDSVSYISVARNLSNGNGFITYDGYPFLLQPPLYPIFLSVINTIFNIDPLLSAGILNALLFGLIIFGTGLFFLNHLKSILLALLGTSMILISYVLIQSALLALSETLFIFFLILYINLFDRYKRKNEFTSLLLFSIAASLACLTRYTGVVLIFIGVLGIFLWGGKY